MIIKNKLLLLFLFIAIFPLTVIGYYSYNNAKNALIDRQITSLESIVDSRISDINLLTQLRYEQARQISGAQIIRQLDPDGDNSSELIDQIQSHLESVHSILSETVVDQPNASSQSQTTNIEIISVWDANGTIIANTDPSLIGQRMSSGFLDGLKENRPAYGGYFYDDLLEQRSLMFFHEIRNINNDRFAGALVFKIQPVLLNQISISRTGLGETGEMLVSRIDDHDENNLIFITQPRHREPDQVTELPINEYQSLPVVLAAKGGNGSGTFEDYRSEEVLAVWKHIPELDWGIVGKIDLAEILTPVHQLRNRILLSGIGLIFISIIFAHYFSKSISDPLKKLSELITQISDGKIDQGVDINRQDEIGDLAKSANQMIRYLKSNIEYVNSITSDKIEIDIQPVSDKDELGKALLGMSVSLQKKYNKIQTLIYQTIEQNTQLNIQHENLRDIHNELQESEARLLAILNNSEGAIITMNDKGCIQTFNKTAETMFGYNKHEVLGKNVNILMPSLHREKHDGYLKNYLETGEMKIIRKSREEYGMKKDGTVFSIDLSISEVRWNNNRIFSAIIMDISDRKKLERRILEAAEEERRRIGRELHDGLGQMLTGIRMVAENLAKKLKANAVPGSDKVEEISHMAREADEYTRKLTHGMIDIYIENKGISTILKEYCNRAENIFGINCDYFENGNIELKNQTFALNLYRIVQESVNNAVKHGQAKNIKVRFANSGIYSALTIDDDGKGFDPDQLEGEGMGIQVMKYRTGILGGMLEIKRTEEEWTRVRCIIPNEIGKF